MQQGANKRQLRPQILQMKDLEKMYGKLNENVTMAEMQAAQMQQAGQQGLGLGALAGPGGGQAPGQVGPMGIPMGGNGSLPGLGGNGQNGFASGGSM